MDQPKPTPNAGPCIQDLVIEDMQQRKAIGLRKYGTVLQPFNGRDALQDAYEESLDQCMYLKQAIIERNQAYAAKVTRLPPGDTGDGPDRY